MLDFEENLRTPKYFLGSGLMRNIYTRYPNQSVVSPLNLYRSPCIAACLAPESAIPKLSQVIQAMHYQSAVHLIGYLVEDGITSSVHAKHTFSRTSIMLRMRIKSRRVSLERWFDVKYLSCRYDRYCCLTSHNVYTWYLS